ncbi:hypothetical protein HPP92_015201 [Vanilla planifolia]|uniref:Transmembrane protein 120 homolog n=1 Tax=Vanilla planifolia TaxID=51239 RepID=A0A835QIQ8_VANPL|nr:hypothetical protein HPP92_015201 [Vanilla planifolia]
MHDNAGRGGGPDDRRKSDEHLLDEASRLSELARELHDSASAFISRTWNEEQALSQRALSLDSALRRLQSSLDSFSRRHSFDHKSLEKVEEDIYKMKCLLADGDVASLLPSKDHGRFLKMFLGPVNVRANRKEVRLKAKEEYNNYRDRTAFLFLLFPSVLIFLRSWMWEGCFPVLPVQLYQKGVQLFLVWAIMQGIAMLLQNRYQRQRLYTRIALGKAKRMDVVWGETAGVEGQLWLLYPILFVLQGFEAFVGLLLLRTAFVVVSEWQVVVCGVLLVLMAVGNFLNTVQTLLTKSRFKAMKRSKSKQDLDQLPSRTNSRK